MAAPKHEQLREVLRNEIERRAPHEMLPTEREIATRYGVSRATVRKAMDYLSDLGVVYRLQGAGTFVHGAARSKAMTLTSFSEEVIGRGMCPSSRVLDVVVEGATGRVGMELGVRHGEPVTALRRLRLADGDPLCLETVHVAQAKAPGLDQHDLTGSLYEILEGRYGVRISRAELEVRAVSLSLRDAALLAVPVGAAAIAVHCVTLDERDRPIECSDGVYRGDRYDLRYAVRR